ncbi:MAG TPA: cytosolic protein [Candidatus Hydrogenedentes bacterium]|nr:cytosolic protein [Candidatus Hydrogenedentota bacterium]
MSDCPNNDKNVSRCNCTYPCGKKGLCCECLHSHLANRQLPACCFPPEVEKTYDRSFAAFIRAWS